MFATMISPEASTEVFASQQELKPIISIHSPEPAEYPQKVIASSKKVSRMEEFTSWEYFLNELEFE